MAPVKSTSTYLSPLLFSATIFTSASLLFWIQPLIAKTLLPFLGGAPAVWNTCLLFFQGMLLFGYLYGLASSRWFGLRAQIALHILLILLLVTQQALDLYLSKLAQGGILAFHISSRSLNLKPILADLAESRRLVCIGFDDLDPSSLEGKDPSQWVVMARSLSEISNLSINSQWKQLEGKLGTSVWSDDFSNILRAIRWQ